MRVRLGLLIVVSVSCLLQPALPPVHASGSVPQAQDDAVFPTQSPTLLAQAELTQQPQLGTAGPIIPNVPDSGLSPLVPGDVISVDVRGEPTVSGVYYVRNEGDVLLPMAGSVRAAGLTPGQLGEQIAAKLRQYVRTPHVTVLRLSGVSRVVSILGAVARPGTYDVRSFPTTLALLGAAGGTTPEADLARMVLVRDGETAPLTRPAGPGEMIIPMDVKLQAGDAVVVPSLRQRSIRIVGAVAQPGLAALEDALTASRAVLAAGGATDLADLSAVQILRGNEVIQVNLRPILRPDPQRRDMVEDVVLELDDVVMVPQVATRSVLVTGQVNTPGAIDAEQAGAASTAVVAAGGATENADLSRAYVLRSGERIALNLMPLLQPERAPAGSVAVDTPVRSGDILVVPERNPIFVIGAVNTPGSLPAGRATTLSQAVVMAGGLAPDADATEAFVLRQGRQIRADLRALLQDGDSSSDVVLEPQDAVVVPRRAQVVQIVGQVTQPGALPLDSAATLVDAWGLAGGATPLGDSRAVILLRGGESTTYDMEAMVDLGDAEQNVRLQPGDTIIVPRITEEVYVLGSVVKPGIYPVREGDTIIDVIAEAGGPSPTAKIGKIAIVRRSEVQQLLASAAGTEMADRTAPAAAPAARRSSAAPGEPWRAGRLDPSRNYPQRERVQDAPKRQRTVSQRLSTGTEAVHLLELAEVQTGDPAYLVYPGDVIYVPPRDVRDRIWEDVIGDLLIGLTLGAVVGN